MGKGGGGEMKGKGMGKGKRGMGLQVRSTSVILSREVMYVRRMLDRTSLLKSRSAGGRDYAFGRWRLDVRAAEDEDAAESNLLLQRDTKVPEHRQR